MKEEEIKAEEDSCKMVGVFADVCGTYDVRCPRQPPEQWKVYAAVDCRQDGEEAAASPLEEALAAGCPEIRALGLILGGLALEAQGDECHSAGQTLNP